MATEAPTPGEKLITQLNIPPQILLNKYKIPDL